LRSGGCRQQQEFVKAHGGKRTDISVYGRSHRHRLEVAAKMNLAMRGIEA